MILSNIRNKNDHIKQWTFATIIYALITISLNSSFDAVMYIAIILSGIFVILFNLSESILFLLGISVFENSFKVFGKLGWFILVSIILLKWIVLHGFNYKTNKKTMYASIALIIVALMTDLFSYGFKGQSISTVTLVILFCILFDKEKDKSNLSAFWMTLFLGSGFVCAIIFILFQYGGMSGFIHSFESSSYAFRFGHAYGDYVGGAMAIPLYSLLIISFSLFSMIEEKDAGKGNLPLLICLDLFAIVFGSLTISRSFYVGVVIIVALFLIGQSKNNKTRGKKLIVLLIISIMSVIVFNLYADVINQLVGGLLYRVDSDITGGTGGRVQIWESCFSYLFTHPYGFITGFGSNGYPIIGQKQNMLFSAGSHNLYIDIFMSWGIIGVISILVIISQFKPEKGYLYVLRNKTLAALPLLTLVVFCMTAMRTNSIKTVIYFFCCFVILNRGSDNNLHFIQEDLE